MKKCFYFFHVFFILIWYCFCRNGEIYLKKVGIIGGMSYESSLHYYERINRKVNAICGDLTCAEMLIYNVNFEKIRRLMLEGKWKEIGNILGDIAKTLEKAGADFIVIATNTMHKLAEQIQSKISIPLLHIADCVAVKCQEQGIKRVGLLGTRYTMEEDFLEKRLEENGIEAVVPDSKEEIQEIDRIIFEELCKGEVKASSKNYYKKVIEKMKREKNIEGVIFGCTEIEMLLQQEDVSVLVFDTTQSHIDGIVTKILDK